MAPSRRGCRRACALGALAAAVQAAAHPNSGSLSRRQVVTDPTSLSGQTFDYVIVGGGTAGLVVANRLSADGKTTVAVIEAGGDGAAVQDRLLAPGMAYWDGVVYSGSPEDWGYTTTAQSSLNGRQIFWPRGKLLGGSSAVNGLYMVRGGKIEHDAWAALNPGSEADWGWDALWPYMKKSETFTPPSSANLEKMSAVVDTAAHGSDGPVHYSYPGFVYDQIGDWCPTWGNLGVTNRDGLTGQNYDCFVTTSCIDPSSWSRSYSKTGYLDPVTNRTNLQVLTGYQVTKINFNGTDSRGNATASGVSFAASATGTTYTVNAAKEVILSSGVIGSPQLLQISGVGPSSLLKGLNIDVVVDLPGVGAHLQDHLSGSVVFQASSAVNVTGDLIHNSTTYNQTQWNMWLQQDADSLYNAPNNAIAYINASFLLGSNFSSWQSAVSSGMSSLVSAYSTDTTIQAGYEAVYKSEIGTILPGPTGAVEFLMGNMGRDGSSLTVQVQCAIQHPMSQGYVLINSTSAFNVPSIDPGYLLAPTDLQLFVAAFKYIRTLAATAPFSGIVTTELSPGASVSTDSDWENYIKTYTSTEYHPAGTCSMLPRSLGGVVNSALQVYGTSNVRVIDASVVPVGLSAHLTAPTYGIAEKGADIILTGLKSTNASSSANSTSSGSGSGSGSSASATHKSGAALHGLSPSLVALIVAFLTVFL